MWAALDEEWPSNPGIDSQAGLLRQVMRFMSLNTMVGVPEYHRVNETLRSTIFGPVHHLGGSWQF